MLFIFNGEALATFIPVTKSCICKDKSYDDYDCKSLGPLKLRLIRIIYHVYVNYDHPGEEATVE